MNAETNILDVKNLVRNYYTDRSDGKIMDILEKEEEQAEFYRKILFNMRKI